MADIILVPQLGDSLQMLALSWALPSGFIMIALFAVFSVVRWKAPYIHLLGGSVILGVFAWIPILLYLFMVQLEPALKITYWHYLPWPIMLLAEGFWIVLQDAKFRKTAAPRVQNMSAMKKPYFIILLVAVAIFVAFISSVRWRFHLESTSPSRTVTVRGLPFKGIVEGPLDGKLRLYINEEIYQTYIPFGSDLKIEWIEAKSGERFTIYKGDVVLMKWTIEKDHPSCVEGKRYLAFK